MTTQPTPPTVYPILLSLINHNLTVMRNLSWSLVLVGLPLVIWLTGAHFWHWSPVPGALSTLGFIIGLMWIVVTVGRYLINHLVLQSVLVGSEFFSTMIAAQKAAQVTSYKGGPGE